MAKVSSGTAKQKEKEATVKLSFQPLMFKQEDCIVLTVTDLSQIEEVASLKAQTDSLQLMSSTVSHEMLTPLKCIIQMVNRMQGSMADVKKSRKYLNTIGETCELILGQIKASLDYNLVNMNMF